MELRELITILKWTSFSRIGLLFMSEYHKENAQVRRDIKLAQKENAEADLFIRAYVKSAEKFAVSEIPF